MNLREYAKGKPCMIRIPGICSHNTEETVLCHFRGTHMTGYGQKAPDIMGAWGCYQCHTYTEQRRAYDKAQRYFLEGIMRTQYQLIQDGIITTQF